MDFINRSEMSHPYSFHNEITGNSIMHVFPSDVTTATTTVEFASRGFFHKDAIGMVKAFEPVKEGILLKLDPRLTQDVFMLGKPTNANRITDELHEEI